MQKMSQSENMVVKWLPDMLPNDCYNGKKQKRLCMIAEYSRRRSRGRSWSEVCERRRRGQGRQGGTRSSRGRLQEA